ncbi:hypothetical protein G6F37_006660 [Rhizopus arrhizus]|nr:hypothetical protein G6F38_007885 [Rhizopus arrhizus]KAG1157488.1 hypothetical protein G6F37_006660 [Rhizopus arrhizus]
MSGTTMKPRSMTAGARNVLRSNDSASLWNCTLSPGWSEEESEILRKALMKFGIGNWAKIIESGCLPGKTNAQMNLQLQRLLGQQSTAEFAGLHIDPKVIGAKNSKIQGPHIRRKNNCIVNTGGKLSREELKKRVASNKEEYELPEEEWKTIELPKVEDPVVILEQKREDMKRLKQELEKVQASILKMTQAHPDRMDKLKSEVTESPSTSTPGTPITEAQQDKEEEEEIKIDDDGDIVIGNKSVDDEEDEYEAMETSILDQDYALAMELQKEEDELLGEYSEQEQFSEDDEEYNNKKKRRVTRK